MMGTRIQWWRPTHRPVRAFRAGEEVRGRPAGFDTVTCLACGGETLVRVMGVRCPSCGAEEVELLLESEHPAYRRGRGKADG